MRRDNIVAAPVGLAAALFFGLFFALSLTLTGCGHHFEIEEPDDFVELEDDRAGYAFRATSAHGVVLAVREVDNESEGNLEFWVDAIKNRMRMNGGYELLEEKDVTAKSGQRGKQLRFGRDQHGVTFRYWLTIFVSKDRVHLIEAGGREELFDEAAPRVERAIANVRVD